MVTQMDRLAEEERAPKESGLPDNLKGNRRGLSGSLGAASGPLIDKAQLPARYMWCQVDVRCNMARRTLHFCIKWSASLQPDQAEERGGAFAAAWGIELPAAVRPCVHLYYAKDAVRLEAHSTLPGGQACRPPSPRGSSRPISPGGRLPSTPTTPRLASPSRSLYSDVSSRVDSKMLHTSLVGIPRQGTRDFTRSLRHMRPASPRRKMSPRRAASPRPDPRNGFGEDLETARAMAQLAISVQTEADLTAADAPPSEPAGLNISRRDR